MKRFKTLMVVGVVGAAFATVGASGAMANGTAHGTLSSSMTSAPCDFAINYTGTAAASAVLQFDGNSFVGDGATQPCDNTTLTLSNFKATASAASPWTAQLTSVSGTGNWSVDTDIAVPPFGTVSCHFNIPSSGSGSVSLTSTDTSPAGVSGPYTGTGNASGTCAGFIPLSGTVTVSNLTL